MALLTNLNHLPLESELRRPCDIVGADSRPVLQVEQTLRCAAKTSTPRDTRPRFDMGEGTERTS